jgi:hypothetical protein
MQPSEFWGCTLFDIGMFIVSQTLREREERKKENNEIYTLALLIGKMNATNLTNAFGGKKRSINYPSFEDVFGEDGLSKKEFKKIDDSNKNDFYKAQLEAYRKMGMKGY